MRDNTKASFAPIDQCQKGGFTASYEAVGNSGSGIRPNCTMIMTISHTTTATMPSNAATAMYIAHRDSREFRAVNHRMNFSLSTPATRKRAAGLLQLHRIEEPAITWY